MFTRKTVVLLLLLMIGLALSAQDLGSVSEQARRAVDANNYPAAISLLTEFVQANPAAGSDVAATYTDFGVLEFNRRNFGYAYSAFREALKLQPTNQTATQYYLRMRREMDVANLRNEYVPPPVAAAPTPDDTLTGSDPVQGSNPALRSTSSSPATAADSEADLQILISQLKAAEQRISSVESSASSKTNENDLLRQQLEQQRQLVEQMLEVQRSPSGSTVAPDNDQLEETIRLLSVIADRDQNRPIVVQSDPALQALLNEFSENQAVENNFFSPRNLILSLSLIMMALILAAIMVVVILALRARKKSLSHGPAHPYSAYNPNSLQLEASGHNELVPGNQVAGLLEFSGPGPVVASNESVGLRAALLKADHLHKMYFDVRSGNLSWETIRNYIDDLEKALKVEILRVVELKLDSGAVITSESALAVLFPFLSDYDDFLSDKANEISKRILIESRGSRGSEGNNSLFSAQNLMEIPRKLAEVLNKKDRSLVTAKLALGIARLKDLSKDDCDLIYKGALAHDAGYLMLDPSELKRIISTPEINEDEWKYIQSHVTHGLDYFGEAEIPELIRDAILHHHERNDGTGYPNGLHKCDIPLVAQIVGISETFASLLSNRSYRDKVEFGHAMAIIKDGARRKFDPDLVTILEQVVKASGGSL